MRHVLVVRQDSVGNVLLAGPAVRAIAASGARVTLLCGPRGRAAAELLPGVEHVLEWSAGWIDPDPAAITRAHVGALIGQLGERGIDEALILTSFQQSPLPLALVLRLAGIPRIGAISSDYPGSLLDVHHQVHEEIHEVERGLSLAEACGYRLPRRDDRRLRIKRTTRLQAGVRAMAPYVVVHPGASVPARAWPPSRHRELVRALVRTGRNVVVTGAPHERLLTASVCARQPPARVLDLGGATDLAMLAEVIAGAEAIVVGNTGAAHVAAAVRTPTVSIYAPTVPAVRWHPWCVPFELLHEDVPCAGCTARECPVPGHPCVGRITPALVLAALARLRWGAGEHAPRPADRRRERRGRSRRGRARLALLEGGASAARVLQ
jgi:ADP-heptose:LPS heptosyltransferase